MERSGSERVAAVLVTVGAVAAVAAAAYLAFAPVYQGFETGRAAPPGVAATPWEERATLAEVNGSRIYMTLLIPILLAGAPLLFPRPAGRRVASWLGGTLLLAFSILGAFTVGLLFLPAALAVLLAALLLSLGGPAPSG